MKKHFKGKKILIVGVGKTGFTLISFFQQFDCTIRVTDIKPIFDLNKVIKKLKKFSPTPAMTFGEHRDEDFLEADVIVYSASVKTSLPQLDLARQEGKEVYSEFSLANKFCDRPIIAVAGTTGRSVVTHMIGFCLKLSGKNVFVSGATNGPFITYSMLPNKSEIDYVIVEVSAVQMRNLEDFRPQAVVFTNIGESYPEQHFQSIGEYFECKLSLAGMLAPKGVLVANFDRLINNGILRNCSKQTYWYSRRSFITLGVMDEFQGTHFHEKRIHSNIHHHSEFRVNKMRIIGQENREGLLAAVTVCKILEVPDKIIQNCVENFPGIPHQLEFLIEKNGVCFYNDSKSETMKDLVSSISSFKKPIILILGGKEIEEEEYSSYKEAIAKHARVLVLVGESKERMNRALGEQGQTYIVGSFEESILFAYQKSRTGDTIILSPGAPATDSFRDYEERGHYFKKFVYQL